MKPAGEPAGESPRSSSAHSFRWVDALDGGATLPRALAAALAWSLAVAPSVFSRGSSAGAKTLGLTALLLGLAGPFLVQLGRTPSRHVGVSGFLALNVAAWLVARQSIDAGRLEPLRAGLGGLAFGVWALAWGDVFRSVGRAVPADGPPLPARSRLPSLAVPIAAASVVGALGIVALAWRIADPARALAAQAAAVAAALALVTVGGTLATSRGAKRDAAKRLPSDARRTLALLAAVTVVGVAALALRGGP